MRPLCRQFGPAPRRPNGFIVVGEGPTNRKPQALGPVRVAAVPPYQPQKRAFELGLTYKFSTGPGGFLFW